METALLKTENSQSFCKPEVQPTTKKEDEYICFMKEVNVHISPKPPKSPLTPCHSV